MRSRKTVLMDAAQWTALTIERVLLRTYCRLEVSGLEHLPKRGGYVIVANHSSHLDAAVIRASLPPEMAARTFAAAAKDYFFKSPIRALIAEVLANAIPLDRRSPGAGKFRELESLLEDKNGSLILFPEGTRSTTGRVGVFKAGVGLIVDGTNIPVVPVYIRGAGRSWPKGSPLPRPARLTVVIGEPRCYSHLDRSRESAEATADDLRKAVLKLSALAVPSRRRRRLTEVASC